MSDISIEVEAVAHHGNPNMRQYGVFVTPDLLRTLLGHDPRDGSRKLLRAQKPELAEVYESVQRPMTAKRRNGLVPYISQRMLAKVPAKLGGVLPSLLVGFTRAPEVDFSRPNAQSGHCRLRLSLSEDEARVLVDGLGRVDSLLAMREGYEVEGNTYRLVPADSSKLPLLIHILAPHPGEEWTVEVLQQKFHDVNCKAEPVRPAHAISGEFADIFIELTRILAECSAIADHGGMGIGSPSPKKDELVSQMQMLKFVRSALGGPRAAESDSYIIPEQDQVRTSRDAHVHQLCAFLEAVAEGMTSQEWEDRNGSFHLTSAGWATMGLVYHFVARLKDELRSRGLPTIDAADLAEIVGKIDWRRTNPDWEQFGVAKRNRKGEVVIAGAGRSTRDAMFKVVLRKIIEHRPSLAEAIEALVPALDEAPIEATSGE